MTKFKSFCLTDIRSIFYLVEFLYMCDIYADKNRCVTMAFDYLLSQSCIYFD